MKKIDKRIEIVQSSLASFRSINQKANEADMIRRVLACQYQDVVITEIYAMHDLEDLIARQPDLVFLKLKKLPLKIDYNKNINDYDWIPDYLDRAGLNYTGSMADALALDFDKSQAKKIVYAAGIKTALHFIATPGQYHSTSELPIPFPLFIKPKGTANSKGIGSDSVVHDFVAFTQKVQAIADECQSASLVETYLPGREYSVAMLKSLYTGKVSAMPIELIAPKNNRGDRILDSQTKRLDAEQVLPVNDTAVRLKLSVLAKSIFDALGARDYGRIDIRLDESGEPNFIEANLHPGFGDGYFARACRLNKAINYEAMILQIVELAMMRAKRNIQLEQDAELVEPTFKTVFNPI